jgi:hypothetical protein
MHITTPTQRIHRKHRANESPMTFVRSAPVGSPPSVYQSRRLEAFSAPTGRWGWWDRVLFFAEESVACMSAASGTHYRESMYQWDQFTQFDTMSVRRVRNFFHSVPTGWQLPEGMMTSSRSSVSSSGDDPQVVVPRLDSQSYSERYYLFRLESATDPVATISIEHVIEELLERCSFLRDPGSTWISRPDRLHVVLAATESVNVTREIRRCKRVLSGSAPIELTLARLMWRGQGTLWAQWHCTGGNIDRLRADLRIASGGSASKIFTSCPNDDPTLSRPFAVETLIMAALFKPTKDELEELKKVTAEMQRMFQGITAKFESVSRVSRVHDKIDKEGGEEVEFVLEKATGETSGTVSFVDRFDLAWFLVRKSPSCQRIAVSVTGAVVLGLVGTMVVAKLFR